MKYITQATEKRIKDMVKREHKFGEALQDVLDQMKCREGWYGESIKGMKRYGVELENSTQLNVSRYYEYLYNGMTVLFFDLFHATFTLGLHCATITDFNKLVKVVDEMETDGWGTY